jgi:hypothetical protein
MTEPDQVEFHERVSVSRAGRDIRAIPVRIGIVAGSAVLVVIGAVAAMGASPAAPSSGQANLSAVVAPGTGTTDTPPLANEFRGGGFFGGDFGRAGFRAITITAINGSSLSLKTDDGWTRTITVGSSTTITKGGATIAVGDLAVGDEIRFAQEKATDGTFSITAIHVVMPTIGGEVTAISGNTITVTGKDGTAGTIHVDSDTTYNVDGTSGKALTDITVGSFVIAEGTLRTDGSLDAATVHSGLRGHFDRPGRGFLGKPAQPDATPTPTPTSNAS